jgi:hypothetical protein
VFSSSKCYRRLISPSTPSRFAKLTTFREKGCEKGNKGPIGNSVGLQGNNEVDLNDDIMKWSYLPIDDLAKSTKCKAALG